MKPISRTLRGIALMVAAMACFALMNAALRALATDMASTQAVFLRSVIGLAITALLVMGRHGASRTSFRTERLRAHLWRGAIGFCAMELWFYSMSILPMTLATALSFTTPIFVTVFAIAFLGERAGWHRWTAIAVSFAAVLLILKPGSEIPISGGVVLLSSALMALSAIVVKNLGKSESPELIVFYMNMVIVPCSLPLAIANWQPVSLHAALLAFIVAYLSIQAQLFLTRAYNFADMVTLMPFDFTRLIFAAGLGYLFFEEKLDALSWLGAAIIAASTVYIAWREHKLALRNTTNEILP